jgi:hypothetical protein
MRKRTLILYSIFAQIFLTSFSAAVARTWHINPNGSGDAPTIQAGIDSTADGDTVSLTNGTYTGVGNRNIDLLHKEITVRSESGIPDSCIIDCEGEDRGFYIWRREGPATVIEGIMVKNGNVGNSAGGGMYCFNSSPTVTNCTFLWNSADNSGGGVYCYMNSSTFTYCTFVGNTASSGGGMFCTRESTTSLINCTLLDNSANFGGGIACSNDASPTLDKIIIAYNSTMGGAIQCTNGSYATLTCSDVYGNAGRDYVDCIAGQNGINGNISVDPEFCGIIGSGNYFLQIDSPCAPGNHPDSLGCGLIGAFDVNCGMVDVKDNSWGSIKSIFKGSARDTLRE